MFNAIVCPGDGAWFPPLDPRRKLHTVTFALRPGPRNGGRRHGLDWTLVLDVGSYVTYLAIPPLLVAGLFLFGWDPGWAGASIGFGRGTFWLLVAGGILGWLGNIPFFLYHGSVMALNVGGGLIPLILALTLFATRVLPGRWHDLSILLGALGVATTAGFLLITLLPAGWAVPALLAAYAVPGVALGFLFRSPGSAARPRLGSYALVSLGVVGTYAITQPVVNVGIVASFPSYLIWPLVLGVLSVPLLQFDRTAPALAYASATLGVLVGADILHEGPLFAALPFLGAIGGAGPLDLVYLSGPIALFVSYFTGKAVAPRARPGKGDLPPLRRGPLDPALLSFRNGEYPAVYRQVLEGVASEAARTWGALYGAPPSRRDDPLMGLEVHPLLRADLQNLQALAREPPAGEEPARAALWTGYLLQRGLLGMRDRRLGTPGARMLAFLIDIGLALAIAVPLTVWLFLSMHFASLTAALDSVPYEAALAALGSWPYVFFVVLEEGYGTTPGKWIEHLRVVGPDGERPGPLAILVRNVPKLIPLAALALAVGEGLPAAYFAGNAGLVLTSVLLGVGVLGFSGLVGLWAMVGNPLRQRVGDLMAGTEVWTRSPPLLEGPGPGPAPRPVAAG